jgi:hypothetical protein
VGVAFDITELVHGPYEPVRRPRRRHALGGRWYSCCLGRAAPARKVTLYRAGSADYGSTTCHQLRAAVVAGATLPLQQVFGSLWSDAVAEEAFPNTRYENAKT